MRITGAQRPARADVASGPSRAVSQAPLVAALGPVAVPKLAKVALPKGLASAVAEASSIPRGVGAVGSRPMIGRHARQRLVSCFSAIEADVISKLTKATASLPGPNARAVLLRAVLAHEAAVRKGELDEVLGFATKLAKGSDEDARTKSTVLDLDHTKNSSSLDPLALSMRRGRIFALHPDLQTDNDGLYQRFTATCGPTVVQMLAAECDPILARSIHDEGLNDDATTDAPAKFQKDVLEEGGGIALGKREAEIRARLRNAVGRLRDELDDKSLSELRDFGSADGPRTKRVDAAIAKVRERFDGFPTEKDLERLGASGPLPKTDAGTSTKAFLAAIHEHVTPRTGVSYRGTNPEGGFARGQAWRHLDAITDALRDGIDIPFGISEPGHWMLLTHVSGNKPHRKFLVADPEGGRTAWVSEKSFVRGTFVTEPFKLTWPGQRGYVDTFLLPIREPGK
ncbi:MAG: hypothetical protein HY791_10555 [Deltaproteobacteria bacterium]|nr:hypothetical protein [Deltaproteobacteria bacterium]